MIVESLLSSFFQHTNKNGTITPQLWHKSKEFVVCYQEKKHYQPINKASEITFQYKHYHKLKTFKSLEK